MILPYVMIFMQISSWQVVLNSQPIYFWTKGACDAVALEINGGPEPTKGVKSKNSTGALCRSMGTSAPLPTPAGTTGSNYLLAQ